MQDILEDTFKFLKEVISSGVLIWCRDTHNLFNSQSEENNPKCEYEIEYCWICEHWLSNDKLHRLTILKSYRFCVELKDRDRALAYKCRVQCFLHRHRRESLLADIGNSGRVDLYTWIKSWTSTMLSDRAFIQLSPKQGYSIFTCSLKEHERIKCIM